LGAAGLNIVECAERRNGHRVRKLIAFDDDTFDKLKQLGRDRMATIQELADEAFADVLRKHGIPVDLKDALRKSAALSKQPASKSTKPSPSRKSKS
jgi:non-homologous end joining protein Ku